MITTIIGFNEARLLPMCLGHLPKDSRVIYIDGAYAEYPHEVPWSTDGTLDIARRWGCEVVEVTKAWPDQMTKRTQALIPGEVIFNLDADELLHTDLPELPDDADVGWVTILSPIYEGPCLMPRVFRVQEGWHFAGRHHWIYDAEKRLVASHSYAGKDYRHAILPVVIENAIHIREDARNAQKVQYLHAQRTSEGVYADEQGVYQPTA